MSGQIHDKFIINDETYDLLAIENANFLDTIEELGFRFHMLSTECYRGCVAMFNFNEEGRLCLKDVEAIISITSLNFENYKYIRECKKKIRERNNDLKNGIIGTHLKSCYKRHLTTREVYLEELNVKSNYTGSLLIGKERINELHVDMGFEPPMAYRNVLLLTFNLGKLVKAKDVSIVVEEMRKRYSDYKEMRKKIDPRWYFSILFEDKWNLELDLKKLIVE